MAVSLTLAAAAAAVGCATRESVESLQRQVAQLQSQNFQLRKDLAEARVRAQMQAERRAAGPAGSTAPAEEAEVEIPLPAASRGGAPEKIYSEPITDASRYTSGPLKQETSGHARPAPAAQNVRTPGTPVELMDGARRALDARQPEAALEMFQRVVTSWPGDALADDAQFGVGECYFQMERYEDAIAAYTRVGELFPYGDQVPSAQLKTGFSLLALHRRPEALAAFRKVSESWPGTEAATVARQQMAHLKAGTP